MILAIPLKFDHYLRALLLSIPRRRDWNGLSMRQKPKGGFGRRTDEGGDFQNQGSIDLPRKLNRH